MDLSKGTLRKAAETAANLYVDSIKSQVEPGHVGEFLVIDLGSGEFVFGPNRTQVSEEAKEKFPDAVRFLMRIGYPAAIHIGNAGRAE